MKAENANEQQVKELAKNFLQTVEDFGSDDLAYAKDEARGEYRGFAALHDRMDANVVLDGVLEAYGIPWHDDDNVNLMNKVMDEVNRLLL